MKGSLTSLYGKLLCEFGPQKWWPADNAYEVVVGAILTQNTNWRNVEKAIINLKNKSKLNEEAILGMPVEQLEALIHPSGFYRQKAARLKRATKKWIEINDKLKNKSTSLSIDELRNELLSVNGIGKETADSIILYALELPVFVIDAYTKRFCKKYFNFESKDYEDYRAFFEHNLPKDIVLFKEYHALIVEWGKASK